jgi:gamma-glutamylcyclotransferase (GGCT)/AIG2-like uncharacterized protein YtfP
MFTEVWERLVDQQCRKMDAILYEYKRLAVKGEVYPGLVECVGGSVSGKLYMGVMPTYLKQLDVFEGEYYKRVCVDVDTCAGVHSAEVYVFRRKYRTLLSSKEWDQLGFAEKGIKRFISSYAGFR